MGCSFFPDWSVDQFCHDRCNDHDAIYRSADTSKWTKVKADLTLGGRVFWHGLGVVARGAWITISGVLLGLGSLLFGWWAWAYRKGQSGSRQP